MVRHVYTDYAHDPKEVKFNKEGKSQGGEHIVAHLAKHAGLPQPDEDEEPAEEDEGQD